MSNLIVPEAKARPPGFDITAERVMDTAARNVIAGKFHFADDGVQVFCTERFFDDHSQSFAEALFSVALLPGKNVAVISHIGVDKRLITQSVLNLTKECVKRCSGGESLLSRLGWLVRGSVHAERKVTLDWGGTEHLGAVVWFVANGWLAPTGDVECNSLGGTWPCAVATDKGKQYVEALPLVVVYKDSIGTVASDPAGWLIDHSTETEKFHRWIRASKSSLRKGAEVIDELSVVDFHIKYSAYPQIG